MSDSSERLQKLKETLLQTEILAQFGGSLVSLEASEFVAGLMRQWYSIDNDGAFQATGETPLSTIDLRPLPVDRIGDYLKRKHPYLFCAGTPGNSIAQTKETPPPALNRAQMSIAEKADYIYKHGESAYLALPANPAETKPLTERPRSTWSVEENADFARRFGSEEYFKIPA